MQYESQSSFCSVQKTRIEGNNMFCDFYNPVNQTYCKRLRVLCPEHYKDPKVSDDQVRIRELRSYGHYTLAYCVITYRLLGLRLPISNERFRTNWRVLSSSAKILYPSLLLDETTSR